MRADKIGLTFVLASLAAIAGIVTIVVKNGVAVTEISAPPATASA